MFDFIPYEPLIEGEDYAINDKSEKVLTEGGKEKERRNEAIRARHEAGELPGQHQWKRY